MSIKTLYQTRKAYFKEHWEYEFIPYKNFDYSILENIVYYRQAGRGKNESFNEAWIMFDTETSKKNKDEICENHVCAWTISIRAFDMNLCTLYGHKPTECIECMSLIHESMKGDNTVFYAHNLAYDYFFLRQYMFDKWQYPIKQLNVNSLRPINIQFHRGIILKDSLILAQRSLEKWGSDLMIENTKAVGAWDYDIIRDQDYEFSDDELLYIEHDTLCGVECLDATAKQLKKEVRSMPFTATGIPREELRNISHDNRGRDWFKKQVLTAEQQLFAEECFHGGFTHNNRYTKGELIDMVFTDEQPIICKDFASSYPFAMMCKLPCEKFAPWCREVDTVENILKYSDVNAFMLTLSLTKVRLKDKYNPMPYLQYSKCTDTINAKCDNGRIISADVALINITSIDLSIIDEYYEWDYAECFDIIFAALDYLPRWFTDYIWKLYKEKTELKESDPVNYALSKAKLNSLFGMCAQHPCKMEWVENYEECVYEKADFNFEEQYEKYCKKYTAFLPYQIGVFVTSIAARRLFDLSKCIKPSGCWLYTDTDSIYAYGWDEDKVKAFNDQTKQFMIDRGYGCIEFNNREYWLGIAEDDGEYKEFVGYHAKCYAKRSMSDKLSITVAGVPKRGVITLNDDIRNFKAGTIFDGTLSGKKQHTYFHKEMYIDAKGNETADSINLSPCDYKLNDVCELPIEDLFNEEVLVQTYGE